MCDPYVFFFFNATATTEIYTLSLHDALPIYPAARDGARRLVDGEVTYLHRRRHEPAAAAKHRSEEHTSELQSQFHLVCRLLLEKKKQTSKCSTVQPSTRLLPSISSSHMLSPA